MQRSAVVHLPVQYLGWYNPLNKETSLNAPRIQHWIQVC